MGVEELRFLFGEVVLEPGEEGGVVGWVGCVPKVVEIGLSVPPNLAV